MKTVRIPGNRNLLIHLSFYSLALTHQDMAMIFVFDMVAWVVSFLATSIFLRCKSLGMHYHK